MEKHLYEVEIEVTWTLTKSVAVWASDGIEASNIAHDEFDPDIFDADDPDLNINSVEQLTSSTDIDEVEDDFKPYGEAPAEYAAMTVWEIMEIWDEELEEYGEETEEKNKFISEMAMKLLSKDEAYRTNDYIYPWDYEKAENSAWNQAENMWNARPKTLK
jgi:hypothetical protein